MPVAYRLLQSALLSAHSYAPTPIPIPASALPTPATSTPPAPRTLICPIPAILYTLIGTAKLQGAEPKAYLLALARAALSDPSTALLPNEIG